MKTFYGYENVLWLRKLFMVMKTFYGYENFLWLWKLFMVIFSGVSTDQVNAGWVCFKMQNWKIPASYIS